MAKGDAARTGPCRQSSSRQPPGLPRDVRRVPDRIMRPVASGSGWYLKAGNDKTLSVGPDGREARDTGANRHCAAARASDGETAPPQNGPLTKRWPRNRPIGAIAPWIVFREIRNGNGVERAAGKRAGSPRVRRDACGRPTTCRYSPRGTGGGAKRLSLPGNGFALRRSASSSSSFCANSATPITPTFAASPYFEFAT